MMATVSKVVQLASFFTGKDLAKETSKNQVICVATQRHRDLFVIGVDKHAKVNLLIMLLSCEVYIKSSQIYSYKDTML